MPRHLISDAHEWINEIPTVPTKLSQVFNPFDRRPSISRTPPNLEDREVKRKKKDRNTSDDDLSDVDGVPVPEGSSNRGRVDEDMSDVEEEESVKDLREALKKIKSAVSATEGGKIKFNMQHQRRVLNSCLDISDNFIKLLYNLRKSERYLSRLHSENCELQIKNSNIMLELERSKLEMEKEKHELRKESEVQVKECEAEKPRLLQPGVVSLAYRNKQVG